MKISNIVSLSLRENAVQTVEWLDFYMYHNISKTNIKQHPKGLMTGCQAFSITTFMFLENEIHTCKKDACMPCYYSRLIRSILPNSLNF